MGNYNKNNNHNAKVRPLQTETDRNTRIRDEYATGSYSYRKLGRIYHLSAQRVWEIVNNNATLEVSK